MIIRLIKLYFKAIFEAPKNIETRIKEIEEKRNQENKKESL